MKLITEANKDDLFRAELDAIQTAIQKLEKLIKNDQDFWPTNSQILAIQVAKEDLAKLEAALNKLKEK